MKKTDLIKLLSFLLIVFASGTYILLTPLDAAVLSKIGSAGEEAKAIQTRLKAWGYYSGAVDGKYGAQTAEAVKYFQRTHGLTADGIAGPKTLEKIGLPTGTAAGNASSGGAEAANSGNSLSNNDLQLLARAVTGEARGEPYAGQVAVASVILNRVKHPSFPNTIAGVVYQPGAFTAVDDGQINVPVQSSCVQAARDAFNGWDPTGGAVYYYNPKTATNQWIRSRPIVTTIGRHVFCK